MPGVYRWSVGSHAAQHRGVHTLDDEFRARIRAAALREGRPCVVSHESAAFLHGLRTLGRWPARVSLTYAAGESVHSTTHVVRRAAPLNEVTTRDGMRVTSVDRTVADVLRYGQRGQAFDIACSALFRPRRGQPMTTVEQLQREIAAAGRGRGVAAARALLEVASDGCESPAESRSRLLMADLGFELPEQQVRFDDERGVYFVDCLWRDSGIVGECDGLAKYLRDDAGDGAHAARAVVSEKEREDAIRALGFTVVRWTTPMLRRPTEFARALERAGVPRRHRTRGSSRTF